MDVDGWLIDVHLDLNFKKLLNFEFTENLVSSLITSGQCIFFKVNYFPHINVLYTHKNQCKKRLPCDDYNMIIFHMISSLSFLVYSQTDPVSAIQCESDEERAFEISHFFLLPAGYLIAIKIELH